MLNRRGFLQTALAASTLPAVLSLSGCESLIRTLGEACPADSAESGGVDWTPDVLHPVFYGYKDLTTVDGAPGPLRIWYPAYEGFTNGPPILKLCLDRWPVVLFLHGQPPCQDREHYRRWFHLPAMLAKSGYVVVVPGYSPVFPQEPLSPNLDYALSTIDWVRTGWEHAKWVDKRTEATAVAGHSYGALLAARVAQARPEISAYVGLSGPWEEFNAPLDVLQAIGAPSLFMWSSDPFALFEDLDHGGLWNQVAGPKYAMVYPGGHFDYLSPWTGCDLAPHGDCPLIEAVAADLAALFISRYMPLVRSPSQIPVNLVPPAFTLTPKQEFFIGGQLSGLKQVKHDARCRNVSLRWVDGTNSGSRQLGP